MSTEQRDSARRIVEDGVDVRARIHELTSRALSGGGLDADEVRGVVKDTIDGVKDGLANAAPQSDGDGRDGVLRQVFDGMSEAVAAAADAARNTVEHAAERGRALSAGELGTMWSRLSSLEQSFLDNVQSAGAELSEHARAQFNDIVTEARRAGTRIGPAAKSAMEAVQGRMGDAAKEALETGVKAVQTIVGEAAMAVSGMLSGVGDALRKRAAKPTKPVPAAKPKTGTRAKPAKKPVAKGGKKAGTKPAKKTATKAAKKKASAKPRMAAKAAPRKKAGKSAGASKSASGARKKSKPHRASALRRR